ncbi:MAG: ABC transporter ATP-binding protein [Candidatus Bathyarchaeia archaeon]
MTGEENYEPEILLGIAIIGGEKMDEQTLSGSVETVKLTKRFDFQNQIITVLDEATFQIIPGEFVVILGHSGAGKSTLLNLIGGLDKPSSGTITVCNTNLVDLDEEELSSFRCTNVGFVFQTYNLISSLTSLENIQFPMKLANCEDESLIESRAAGLLKLVGLSQRADHLPFQLSCGEQQRVAIARALANDPPLVLADEPTGNLDWDTGREIILFLKQLCEEQRKTMIIVTHDERLVELADTTMRLAKGRITNIAKQP